MPLPISNRVPDQIATLIKNQGWTSLKDFAAAEPKMKLSTVYSVLSRTDLVGLRNVRKIARTLEVPLVTLLQLLQEQDSEKTKSTLRRFMNEKGIRSFRHIEALTGVSSSTISDIIAGKIKLDSLASCMAISNKLGLSLDDFADIFETKKAVVK